MCKATRHNEFSYVHVSTRSVAEKMCHVICGCVELRDKHAGCKWLERLLRRYFFIIRLILCVCVYIYIYIYYSVCVYTYLCNIHICVCIYTHTYTYMHEACTSTFIHICTLRALSGGISSSPSPCKIIDQSYYTHTYCHSMYH
jgi:hypothetical protein